jgi:hypothetical protein
LEAWSDDRPILLSEKQYTDVSNPFRVLRARRERPRDHGTAEQRDELATLHHSSKSSDCFFAARIISSWLARGGDHLSLKVNYVDRLSVKDGFLRL